MVLLIEPVIMCCWLCLVLYVPPRFLQLPPHLSFYGACVFASVLDYFDSLQISSCPKVVTSSSRLAQENKSVCHRISSR